MIDVTMTAVMRPDIIKKTLTSFKERLFWKQPVRLIINVDPVGEKDKTVEVMDVVRSVFPYDQVLWRFPDDPSFPKAFIWTWEQTREPLVFHLEDDWELLRQIDFGEMIQLMHTHKDLAVLRLPYTPCLQDTNKSWNKFLPWNGEFYEVPEDLRGLLGFAGHPSLIRGEFIKIGLKMLSSERNPEKTLKWRASSKGLGGMLQKFRYGVYGTPGKGSAVRDTGKNWKELNRWKKQGSQANFMVWEKVCLT